MKKIAILLFILIVSLKSFSQCPIGTTPTSSFYLNGTTICLPTLARECFPTVVSLGKDTIRSVTYTYNAGRDTTKTVFISIIAYNRLGAQIPIQGGTLGVSAPMSGFKHWSLLNTSIIDPFIANWLNTTYGLLIH